MTCSWSRSVDAAVMLQDWCASHLQAGRSAAYIVFGAIARQARLNVAELVRTLAA